MPGKTGVLLQNGIARAGQSRIVVPTLSVKSVIRRSGPQWSEVKTTNERCEGESNYNQDYFEGAHKQLTAGLRQAGL